MKLYSFKIRFGYTSVVDNEGECIGTAYAFTENADTPESDIKQQVQKEADELLGEPYDYMEFNCDELTVDVPDAIVNQIIEDYKQGLLHSSI